MHQLHRFLRRAAASLGVACAAISSAWAAQSVRVVSLGGIPIATDPLVVSTPVFQLEWEAVDTDCNLGVDELDVWIDGLFYNSFDIDSGEGFSGIVLLNRTLFVTPDCEHTVHLIAYMGVPGSCGSTQPQAVSSEHLFWTSTLAECVAGQKSCKATKVAGPIDVTTGEMDYEITDLTLAGPLPIELVRHYDSRSTFDGPLGYGWQHNYLIRLVSGSATRMVFVDAEAHRTQFRKSGQGVWVENEVDHLTLTPGTLPAAPAWTVMDPNRKRYEFDVNGRLTRIVDRNGNAVVLIYSGESLTTIGQDLDNDGVPDRSLTLAYDDSNRLQTVSTGLQFQEVTYGYAGEI